MYLSSISHIPSNPWIYFFKDKKWIILYIWKAKNLKKRVAQYFSPNSVWKQDMLSKADKVDFLIVKNESEALYLEDNLIKKNLPEFNNLLKADNSYAYIKITNEPFPQIFITRKKNQEPGPSTWWPYGPSTYIGPKHNTIHLKKFLQYLRQILQFRGCKNTQFKQGKLCSDYYFGLCKWRCAKSKNLDSKQYHKIIGFIESFFKGNTHLIQYEIKSQIEKAVKEQNFERAGKLRDIYVHIDELAEQQTVVIQKPITGYLSKIKKACLGRSTGSWSYRVYCVCNFYEGKLIDVIRGKESVEDMDETELQKSLEREFGEINRNALTNPPPRCTARSTALVRADTVSPDKGKGPFRVGVCQQDTYFWISNSVHKLSKHDTKEIDALMERFFDSYVISTSFEGENLNNNVLSQLQKRYHLKHFPYRIECIDISHLSWWRMSGGLSCLVEGLKNPKGYRRYKIHGTRNAERGNEKWNVLRDSRPATPDLRSDDYAALQEVIERRLGLKAKDYRPSTDWPDLLVLDWGKGQLWIIKKILVKPSLQGTKQSALLEKMDIISLWKWAARKKSNIGKASSKQLAASSNMKKSVVSETVYYFDSKLNIHGQDLIYDEVDKVLLKARDEAHRFANAYRKKQMEREFKK